MRTGVRPTSTPSQCEAPDQDYEGNAFAIRDRDRTTALSEVDIAANLNRTVAPLTVDRSTSTRSPSCTPPRSTSPPPPSSHRPAVILTGVRNLGADHVVSLDRYRYPSGEGGYDNPSGEAGYDNPGGEAGYDNPGGEAGYDNPCSGHPTEVTSGRRVSASKETLVSPSLTMRQLPAYDNNKLY